MVGRLTGLGTLGCSLSPALVSSPICRPSLTVAHLSCPLVVHTTEVIPNPHDPCPCVFYSFTHRLPLPSSRPRAIELTCNPFGRKGSSNKLGLLNLNTVLSNLLMAHGPFHFHLLFGTKFEQKIKSTWWESAPSTLLCASK
jgi:hypothetical protein